MDTKQEYKVVGSPCFEKFKKDIRDALVRKRIDESVNQIGRGDFSNSKYIGNRIFEARIHLRPGYRLYFMMLGKYIAILKGGVKDTQDRDAGWVRAMGKNCKSSEMLSKFF